VLLQQDFGVVANVWSVTSFNELARDGIAVDRYNRMHPLLAPQQAYVTQCLAPYATPVLAATDYIRAYAEQIRAYVPNDYTVLGTDGFGRSDTRAHLREFFEVDAHYIAYTALTRLVAAGQLADAVLTQAIQRYAIGVDKPNPWQV
jgi:pyruvate dehydrogenase E1 component